LLDAGWVDAGDRALKASFPAKRAAPDDTKLGAWPRTQLRWEQCPFLITKSAMGDELGQRAEKNAKTVIIRTEAFYLHSTPMPTPSEPPTARELAGTH
jgi:hypothetical protein